MKDFVVIITLNDGDEVVKDVTADTAEEAVLTGWDAAVGMQVADVFVDSEQS
jgi:hemoglobin-like flavoprotein